MTIRNHGRFFKQGPAQLLKGYTLCLLCIVTVLLCKFIFFADLFPMKYIVCIDLIFTAFILIKLRLKSQISTVLLLLLTYYTDIVGLNRLPPIPCHITCEPNGESGAADQH